MSDVSKARIEKKTLPCHWTEEVGFNLTARPALGGPEKEFSALPEDVRMLISTPVQAALRPPGS
jgi:hypothetical protein